MRIEDFGFQPTVGEEYVITFTSQGNLLSTSIYNGADLPPVSFPDNSMITFTVTHRETGKVQMTTDFISYNGKLYKTTFKLPLKNEGTNKNANVYIKDLHYDLTTGSVLVNVQGFEGEQYSLTVSDKEFSHEVLAMPITLSNDTHYSIPTTLVQGAEFQVTLMDAHGKSIDVQEFTAPIDTNWRQVEDVSSGEEVVLDDPNSVVSTGNNGEPIDNLNADNPDFPMDGQENYETIESDTSMEIPMLNEVNQYKTPIIIGASVLIGVIILALIVRMMKKRKNNSGDDDNFEGPVLDDYYEDYPVDEDYSEYEEEDNPRKNKKDEPRNPFEADINSNDDLREA